MEEFLIELSRHLEDKKWHFLDVVTLRPLDRSGYRADFVGGGGDFRREELEGLLNHRYVCSRGDYGQAMYPIPQEDSYILIGFENDG